MKRTINLYHPSLKPSKERLPLSTVLLVNGAVIAILIAFTVVFDIFIESKKQLANNAAAEITQIKRDIDELNETLEKKRNTQSLQQELDDLRLKIENRSQLLNYMQSSELSHNATQYQQVMDDLANFHHTNIWLTSIVIENDSLRLIGNTTQPSAIPLWLQQLQESSFFRGKTFSEVTFKNYKDNEDVKTFTLSTNFDGEADD